MAVRQSRTRSRSHGYVARRLWLLALILVSTVLLIVGRNATAITEAMHQSVADWSAPVLGLAAGPLARVRELGSRLGSYGFLSGEVRRLREENARLRAWKSRALELETRVRHYEELLNAGGEPAIGFLTARVIADARGPFVRTVLVNAGRARGVRENQAVMDGQGLVGRTVTAGQDASRVLLVSDLNSRIPVRIEPQGYRAILTGTNRAAPRIEFLPDRASLHEGDLVYTSGDGGQLPPGLPVGIVEADDAGGFKVTLHAEPGRLNFVRILDYSPSLKVEAQAETPRDAPVTKVAGTDDPGGPGPRDGAEQGADASPPGAGPAQQAEH